MLKLTVRKEDLHDANPDLKGIYEEIKAKPCPQGASRKLLGGGGGAMPGSSAPSQTAATSSTTSPTSQSSKPPLVAGWGKLIPLVTLKQMMLEDMKKKDVSRKDGMQDRPGNDEVADSCPGTSTSPEGGTLACCHKDQMWPLGHGKFDSSRPIGWARIHEEAETEMRKELEKGDGKECAAAMCGYFETHIDGVVRKAIADYRFKVASRILEN